VSKQLVQIVGTVKEPSLEGPSVSIACYLYVDLTQVLSKVNVSVPFIEPTRIPSEK
jgi:hypothetical protein